MTTLLRVRPSVRLTVRRATLVAGLTVSALVAAACGSDDETRPERLILVAYDEFTPPEGAFDAFTDATGIDVEVALGGDAGELVA